MLAVEEDLVETAGAQGPPSGRAQERRTTGEADFNCDPEKYQEAKRQEIVLKSGNSIIFGPKDLREDI
ncbi:hypothetical protein PybrP1_006373 [[Pythium] brassicae (nom. inval.)]|nr:hypothetical protein PybrP1_006373 [[Pythium] brassicae (nom. inval.)]